jgi:N-acyl-D-amino-acid deacylase
MDIKRTISKFTAVLFFSFFSFIPTVFAEITVNHIPVTGTQVVSPFDQRFVNFLKRWRVPGATVVIMRNNRILLARGYGWADLQTHEVVEPGDLFRLGSVSKTITSVTILKLAEEGKLHLDSKVFPLLQNLKPIESYYNPQIDQITIRNLLQMASGWNTNIIDPMFGPWSTRMLHQLSQLPNQIPPDCETAGRMMMSMPLSWKPGAQYSYSNLNYCLLGLVINNVNGLPYGYQNYEAYVQQHILAPIGITDMRIGNTLLEARAPNEVKYYSSVDLTPQSDDLVGNLVRVDGLPYSNSQILAKNFADGGWIASSLDLAKFLQAIGDHRILSSSMLRVMTEKPTYMAYSNSRRRKTDSTGFFSMGISVKLMDGHWYWFKTGTFTGTYALIMQREDDNTSYVALFNTKPPQLGRFVAQLRPLLIHAV